MENYNFGPNVIYYVFLCLHNGGLKSLLVKLIRTPFLTYHKIYKKEIQEARTVFVMVLGPNKSQLAKTNPNKSK